MILFIDTETSGFPKNGVGLEDPTQARILEIGAILTDDQGKIVATLDSLVKCGDIVLHEKLKGVHDITVEECNENGLDNVRFIKLVDSMYHSCNTIVGHNIEFDLKMLSLYYPYLNAGCPILFCTMKSTTDICKIPNRWGTGYKYPSLNEAYTHFFGETKKSKHRAFDDAMMCKEIYFKLQEATSGK